MVAVAAISGALLILATLAYFFIGMFSQITPAEAQKACESFFQDAKSQVKAVPGYSIVHEGKNCQTITDEAQSTDYLLLVFFRVSNNPATGSVKPAPEVKGDVEYLISQLPRKNFVLRVKNESPLNGQAVTYCITADRYLDNNGTYIEQDPSGSRGGYSEPGSIPGYVSGCGS